MEASSKMDIHEFRVFMTMLTMVLPEDEDFTEYEIKTKDIIKLFSLGDDGRYYHAIRDAAARLFSKSVILVERKDDGQDYKVSIHLLDETSEPIKESEQNRIRVKFNPKLKPYLLQLKREYLTIDVRNVENLQSPSSLKLYIVLKHQYNLGNKKVSYTVARLKDILAIESHEYPLYGNFKQKVINKGMKDLDKHTDLNITKLEEIKSGRAVQTIVFHLEGKILTPVVPVKSRKSPMRSRDQDDSVDLGLGSDAPPFDEYEIEEADAPVENRAVKEILEPIKEFVSEETVQTWIEAYPIEQIHKGVSYSLRQMKKGKIRNAGAYIQKMVATPNLLDSEQLVWDKEQKKDKNKKLEVKKANEIDSEIETLRKQAHEQALELFYKLISEKEEALPAVIGKLKQGLFGSYYKDRLSLEQNLADPALSGILLEIAKKTYPDSFAPIAEITKRILQLEKKS